MAADVAVIIPTLRRPEGLERALRSAFAQVGSLDRIAAVVVADNDPDGSAAPLVQRLQAEAPVPLIYTHAPLPGVATARNVGLAATDAPLIAFLDDDEAASPGWLAALLDAQAQTGADVLFGPIRGRVPENTGWTSTYLERFFGRDGPDVTGLTDDIHGEVVEAALAHVVQNKVEAAYRRTDLFERRRWLMDDWAEYLAGRRAGTET